MGKPGRSHASIQQELGQSGIFVRFEFQRYHQLGQVIHQTVGAHRTHPFHCAFSHFHVGEPSTNYILQILFTHRPSVSHLCLCNHVYRRDINVLLFLNKTKRGDAIKFDPLMNNRIFQLKISNYTYVGSNNCSDCIGLSGFQACNIPCRSGKHEYSQE